MGPRAIFFLFGVLAVAVWGGSLRGEEASLLARLEAESIAAVAKVRPGVVRVVAQRDGVSGPAALIPAALSGSGVVWSREGLVVTAAQIVSGAGAVSVVDAKDRTIPAEKLGHDPQTGIGVLWIRPEGESFPVPARGDSKAIQPGAWLFVVGNSHGLAGTVSMGIASGSERVVHVGSGPAAQRGLLQTTAPINPGDSGGALVNIRGEVVGIILSSYNRAPSEGGIQRYYELRGPEGRTADPELRHWTGPLLPFSEAAVGSEGVGFAVPVHRIERCVDEIAEHGRVRRGWFGFTLRVATEAERLQLGLPEEGALVVTGVQPGSPAERSGVQVHDLLLSVDGRPIGTLNSLHEVREELVPGAHVTLVMRRKGEEKRLDVVLGESGR